MKLIVQIGYQKSLNHRKYGQSVVAMINDIPCKWSDGCGEYISSRVEASQGILWYLWMGSVEDGDVLRFEVKTHVTGAGPDEQRTLESLYRIDASAPVKEIKLSGIGHRDYPLIKGRIIEAGTVTESDKRTADLHSLLKEDGF